MPYYREKGPGVQAKRVAKIKILLACLKVRGGSLPSNHGVAQLLRRRKTSFGSCRKVNIKILLDEKKTRNLKQSFRSPPQKRSSDFSHHKLQISNQITPKNFLTAVIVF